MLNQRDIQSNLGDFGSNVSNPTEMYHTCKKRENVQMPNFLKLWNFTHLIVEFYTPNSKNIPSNSFFFVTLSRDFRKPVACDLHHNR